MTYTLEGSSDLNAWESGPSAVAEISPMQFDVTPGEEARYFRLVR